MTEPAHARQEARPHTGRTEYRVVLTNRPPRDAGRVRTQDGVEQQQERLAALLAEHARAGWTFVSLVESGYLAIFSRRVQAAPGPPPPRRSRGSAPR